MAIIKKKPSLGKRVIDLTGPQGNAFFLIGISKLWGRDMGMSKDEISEMNADMTSGDYEHLIEVFDKHFGSFCDLER